MKKARIIAFLMLLAMLIPTVAACNNGTNGTVGSGVVESQSGDPRVDPEIPADITFEGYDFTFFVGTNVSTCPHIFSADAESEDAIDQAIYKRNMAIEEKYNVKVLEVYKQKDDPTGAGAAFESIQQACESEDTLYDAAVASSYDCGTLAQSGYIANLRNYGYIKLDKAWWDQAAIEQLTILGATYFTSGDISYIDDNYTYAIIFNKDMAKANQMPDFYDIVKNGEWTYDKLFSFSRQVTQLDSVDGYSEDDIFGFLGYNDTAWMQYSSVGARIASINEDGAIELTAYNEKTQDMFNKWVDFSNSEASVNWQMDSAANKATWKTIYQNDQALFFGATIQGIYTLRDTDTDYGFLPWPKYDTDQENYHSGLSPNHISLFCIPNVGDQEHIDRASILVTALSVESSIVTEAFYEKNLQGKSVRDDESYATLDLIFANRIYDLGYYYNIGSLTQALRKDVRNNEKNFASTYAANEQAALKKIADINALYKKVAEEAAQ